MERVYICIDLKSFYASVECVERNLNPLNTNLVVADEGRTEKTICLAVTPSLKKFGIPGRARLYEVLQKVKEVNIERKKKNNNKKFTGKSCFEDELLKDKSKELDLIIAPPRMKIYMEYSTKIYSIYLRFVAPEDIFPYSIDEIFCDITSYLKTYKMTPRELITKMIKTVYDETGITATGGIGTNMYLAKIAMDIVAKHMEANEYGVRVAGLDEITYRKLLWTHRPLTSFWRVGRGIAKTLEENNIYTMGDIARTSLENEELLYKLFGVNAEYLIDHAWGWEPCTMEEAKKYKPKVNSISTGQVLHKPYDYEHTKLIVKEMTDSLVLDLVNKNCTTNAITLEIGYDKASLKYYEGEITIDRYGRKIPKHAHGITHLGEYTSSSKKIIDDTIKLYEKIINKNLLVRRITVTANNIQPKEKTKEDARYEQINLFTDYEEEDRNKQQEKIKNEKEENLQNILLTIKNKYGNNSIMKVMNLEEGGTAIERNEQVGGHKG